RGRPSVHREMENRLALSRGGPGGWLLQGLDGASGAFMESPGPAAARSQREQRVAERAARGVRARGGGVRPRRGRLPGRGAGSDDHDLRAGLRARAAGGNRRGTYRAARLDRALARVPGGEEECVMTTIAPPAPTRGRGEQSRARYPDEEGFIERDGVRVFWESYGQGEQTVLFLPTWTLVHSRVWKAQIPYFARHFRVVCFDPRGNGRSDRPTDPAAYAEAEFAEDAIDVMDACGVDRAVRVALSRGAQRALLRAGDHPERVAGLVFVGPMFPVSRVRSLHWRLLNHPRMASFAQKRPLTTRGWGKVNPYYWTHGGYADFVQWWAERMLPEPHSTKQIEDAVAWSHDTDGARLAASAVGRFAAPVTRREQIELSERVRCPVLVIHGTKDRITPYADGKALAKITGGRLETVKDGGHLPQARKPVQVNLALREFVEAPPLRDPTVHRSDGRKRALYISSPIGLGHAQRDVAIARELRKLVDGLEIDWLAQDPVTRVLEAEGERIHPASDHLANESKHIESESAEHDLHCFQAWRRMDEILINNFMVFHDVVREDRYDLWVGDEAWELDYYLHENPREKRARYAWLTDFV